MPTFFAIKRISTGEILGGPHGTSSAPHLYHTRGKASAAMKNRFYRSDDLKVVEVQLIEITQGE